MAITLKRLTAAFGEEAAVVLVPVLTRAYDEDGLRNEFEVADKRYRECYHAPSYEDMALHVVDAVIGGYGVEGWPDESDYTRGVSYVNMGYSYAETVVLDADDEFHVGTWADFAPDEE